MATVRPPRPREESGGASGPEPAAAVSGAGERQGAVAGVVLAAGSSRRMGANKLLLPLGGATVVRRAVETALAAGLDPVVVVVGHERERVRAELADLRCEPVPNPDHAEGIHTSLRAGIAAVPPGCGAAVVLLADMPLVTPEMVRVLVERFRAAEAPLVVSVYGGVLAPPALYGRAIFPELLAAEGEGAGKRIATRHRAEAIEVAWPAAALADLDEPADVERLRGRRGGKGS